jgi:hypothetical protein
MIQRRKMIMIALQLERERGKHPGSTLIEKGRSWRGRGASERFYRPMPAILTPAKSFITEISSKKWLFLSWGVSWGNANPLPPIMNEP